MSYVEPEPGAVLPGEAVADVRRRWAELHARWSFLRVLEPGEAATPGEDVVGVAPALAEVVAALPGVDLGGWTVDWPQGASQRWPELDVPRSGYQPLWVGGREALVVLVDLESGAAGEVVFVAGDVERALLPAATDVVSWWERFTGWVETSMAELEPLLLPDADGDPEELQILLAEGLDIRFYDFLRS